jgi:hypothetical protein
MADIQRQSQFDLGGKALTATNHHHNIKQQQDKSSATFNNSTFTSTEAFSIPPSLLTSARVEQYGQSTPPEFSSTFLVHDKRESFIPVEQLRNETTFVPHQGPSSLQLAPAERSSVKQRRTSRRTTANYDTPATGTMPSILGPPLQENVDANLQPPKRKRGRPKSQPQMVGTYTTNEYALQIPSARQKHLEKNRVAAHKCRQRSKEYINSLETRTQNILAKNKMLMESVESLRWEALRLKDEVLNHAECDFWAVDQYLTRCAEGLLGMKAPALSIHHWKSLKYDKIQSPARLVSHLDGEPVQKANMEPINSIDTYEFSGRELLENFINKDMDNTEI